MQETPSDRRDQPEGRPAEKPAVRPVAVKPQDAEKRRAAEAKRQAKIDRWRRPLEGRLARMHAWADMLLVDHGIFRLIWSNTWRISDRAWRSAQPAPHNLRRFRRAGGRTVVTLRGGQTFGSLPLERETCEAKGLLFRTFVLRSRGLPSREELLRLRDFLDTIEAPVLFHCKSGADRAGFMAALWLVFEEGRPVREARRQLGLRYGHIRQSKTGVLDAFFDAYEAEGAAKGLDLMTWIETVYEPQRILARFREKGWANLLVDRLLNRE